ncbi:MAG: hypothetical protein MZW92_71950 [Comamonadaceae bacterium]|nr:hypothetical protein [Comamonadaceae bacterium]
MKKIQRFSPDNVRVNEQLAELYIQEGNVQEAKLLVHPHLQESTSLRK